MTREEKVVAMVELRESLVTLFNEIRKDEETLKFKKEEYKTMKSKYESIDMELALDDERYEKVKKETKVVKETTEKLTLDDILGLAAMLGISLEIEGENNETI